jgi:hypothetical protein
MVSQDLMYLARYRASGVDEELFNCSDIDQYETLRVELTALGESLGVPFARELERLEERIAELERPEPEYDEGGGLGRSFEPTSGGVADSDAAIR